MRSFAHFSHSMERHAHEQLMTSLWPHESISPLRPGLALLGLIHLLVGELDLVSGGLLERIKLLTLAISVARADSS